VREFVEKGGGFLMVGGYLSFAGLNGMARWGGTEIETLLPVSIARSDDRAEIVQGFRFDLIDPDHPIVAGLPWEKTTWTLCGYNKLTLKDGATLVASYQGDPLIACWEYKVIGPGPGAGTNRGAPSRPARALHVSILVVAKRQVVHV
jgi:uncharacterized membrane protein